jgi:hypothetical protein
MEKKPLCTEIPEPLKYTLDELSKQSGRNKNIIVGASLHLFLEKPQDDQENIIRKYLNDYSK